jgi:hypothetical protein
MRNLLRGLPGHLGGMQRRMMATEQPKVDMKAGKPPAFKPHAFFGSW